MKNKIYESELYAIHKGNADEYASLYAGVVQDFWDAVGKSRSIRQQVIGEDPKITLLQKSKRYKYNPPIHQVETTLCSGGLCIEHESKDGTSGTFIWDDTDKNLLNQRMPLARFFYNANLIGDHNAKEVHEAEEVFRLVEVFVDVLGEYKDGVIRSAQEQVASLGFEIKLPPSLDTLVEYYDRDSQKMFDSAWEDFSRLDLDFPPMSYQGKIGGNTKQVELTGSKDDKGFLISSDTCRIIARYGRKPKIGIISGPVAEALGKRTMTLGDLMARYALQTSYNAERHQAISFLEGCVKSSYNLLEALHHYAGKEGYATTRSNNRLESLRNRIVG